MLETLELIGLLIIPAFLILDLFAPKRRAKAPRWWKLNGFAVTVASLAISIATATFWATLIGERSVFQLSGLGTAAGAVIGIVVYQFVHYWYHRMVHRSDFLFTKIHQLHHSAESIDAYGAYFLHPLDTILFTTWSSLVFFPLLGLTPMAGVIGAVFLTFNALFQHMNKSTPQWIGYIIQRPESHVLHHERGRHERNYADLPLMDMLFGTFANPRSVDGVEAGYYDGASSRMGAMLIGRDVGSLSTAPAMANAEQEIRDDEMSEGLSRVA